MAVLFFRQMQYIMQFFSFPPPPFPHLATSKYSKMPCASQSGEAIRKIRLNRLNIKCVLPQCELTVSLATFNSLSCLQINLRHSRMTSLHLSQLLIDLNIDIAVSILRHQFWSPDHPKIYPRQLHITSRSFRWPCLRCVYSIEEISEWSTSLGNLQ